MAVTACGLQRLGRCKWFGYTPVSVSKLLEGGGFDHSKFSLFVSASSFPSGFPVHLVSLFLAVSFTDVQ